MWLYTVNNWFAARERPFAHEYSDIKEYVEALAYEGDFSEGLRLIRAYRNLFMERSGRVAALEFKLLSVSQIPDDVDRETLSSLGVRFIKDDYDRLVAEAASTPTGEK